MTENQINSELERIDLIVSKKQAERIDLQTNFAKSNYIDRGILVKIYNVNKFIETIGAQRQGIIDRIS